MKKNIKQIIKCRICKSTQLYKFLDLGSMPIPNGFLTEELLEKREQKYELACIFCENCGLVHLTNVVNPDIMFKNYVYIPSTARNMMNNFNNLASYAVNQYKLKDSSLVIDIGSNDGSLLTFFKSYGVRILGIDPAENLAKIAELKGVPTVAKLFNSRVAQSVAKRYGGADVITATNVIAHIDDLHEMFKGVSALLSKDGVFITEFPYLLDLIQKNQFDTIYHEHLSYYSIKPWKVLLDEFGFEIIDAQRLPIHGGSIRLIHRKKKSKKGSSSRMINTLMELEEKQGLYERKTYDDFSTRVSDLKIELNDLLRGLKKDKKRIVGYGAAAKGNVLTNIFDIGTDVLDYIVDSTPYKQGLYTPGKHIPVHAESKLVEDMPDYTLILAWNFADEIMDKQKEYKKKGGKFIIPIPRPKIV